MFYQIIHIIEQIHYSIDEEQNQSAVTTFNASSINVQTAQEPQAGRIPQFLRSCDIQTKKHGKTSF